MNRKPIVVLALSAVMILSYISVYNENAAAWTSPGTGQSYTLTWLEENTNAVTEGQEQGSFFLVLDIIISRSDTLTFDAGEYLYIYPSTKIVIWGDWEVDGVVNDEMYITMSNGVESTSNNIEWHYHSDDENTYSISYLTMTYVLIQLDTTEDDGMVFHQSLSYTNDVPQVQRSDSYRLWLDGHDTNPYATDPALSFKGTNTPKKSPFWDTDGDFMPDEWEKANGFDPTDLTDALNDPDNDLLINRDEYLKHCNPRNWDTDGDLLDDGEEYWSMLGDSFYDADPTMQDSDSDGTMDDYYEVLVNAPNNPYETDPWEADTDSDNFGDLHELNNDYDPTDPDMDSDDILDGRDPDPEKFNRRFAFVFEVRYYVLGTRNNYWGCDDVANIMDDHGWEVTLVTDTDYGDDLNEDVDDIYFDVDDDGGCDWVNFGDGWEQFWDRDASSGTFTQDDISSEPAGYGKDIVFVYLAATGRVPTGQNFQMWFRGETSDEYKEEDQLETFFTDRQAISDCIEVFWVQSHYSKRWEYELDISDSLGANDRIIVTCEGNSFSEDAIVFEALDAAYLNDMNKGFEDTFDDLVDADDHYIIDEYSENTPAKDFYFE